MSHRWILLTVAFDKSTIKFSLSICEKTENVYHLLPRVSLNEENLLDYLLYLGTTFENLYYTSVAFFAFTLTHLIILYFSKGLSY